MPLKRDQIERQLAAAQADLETRVKKLNDGNVSGDDLQRDPKWRSLDSRCRELKGRLRAVQTIEARESALQQSESSDNADAG